MRGRDSDHLRRAPKRDETDRDGLCQIDGCDAASLVRKRQVRAAPQARARPASGSSSLEAKAE